MGIFLYAGWTATSLCRGVMLSNHLMKLSLLQKTIQFIPELNEREVKGFFSVPKDKMYQHSRQHLRKMLIFHQNVFRHRLLFLCMHAFIHSFTDVYNPGRTYGLPFGVS
jgi:hypothetical protein